MNDYNYYVPFLGEELRKKYFSLAIRPDDQDERELKESDFGLLSKRIKKELDFFMTVEQKKEFGTMISASTIEKIIKGTYLIKPNFDKRFLNTLHKISIFLDNEDWFDFVKKHQEGFNEKKEFAEIQKLLIDSSQKTIDFFLKSPNVSLKDIESYHAPRSSAFSEIRSIYCDSLDFGKAVLQNQDVSKLVSVTSIEKISEDVVLVNTRQYWEIGLNSLSSGFDIIRGYTYLLVRISGRWKISDKFKSTSMYATVMQGFLKGYRKALEVEVVKMGKKKKGLIK